MFRLQAVVVFFAVAMTFTMSAQTTPDLTELQRRVKELEMKLESMTRTSPSPELEELRQQIEILTREIETLKLERESDAPEAEGRKYGLGDSASKVYRVRRGVSIGGYGELVYENFSDENQSGGPSGRKDQLDLLRAVLYAGYKFNDRVIFNSELEVEHATTGEGIGEVSMELAYLDFLIDPRFNVRAGLMLMPVGLINELHEPTAFLSAKRPELERAIIPSTWREPGVGLFGEWNRLSYRAYVVTGLKSDGFSASGIRSGRQKGAIALAEDFAAVTRLDWSPVEGSLYGGSIYSGDSSQGSRTPAGSSYAARVTLVDLHASVALRGLTVRALWSEGRIGNARQINLSKNLTGTRSVGGAFGGWYAEAGYDVFSRSPHGEHSLTPFVRYETFDTQNDVPSGFTEDPLRERDTLTLGVAWKPIPQAAIKLDFQKIENGAGTGVDQVSLALGYIF